VLLTQALNPCKPWTARGRSIFQARYREWLGPIVAWMGAVVLADVVLTVARPVQAAGPGAKYAASEAGGGGGAGGQAEVELEEGGVGGSGGGQAKPLMA
jgi:hypothetical protein